jgi:hypothetical protein
MGVMHDSLQTDTKGGRDYHTLWVYSKGVQPGRHLDLDFWSLELRDQLLFKSPSRWYLLHSPSRLTQSMTWRSGGKWYRLGTGPCEGPVMEAW